MRRDRSAGLKRRRAAVASCALAWLALTPLAIAQPPPAAKGALARLRDTGRIRFRLRTDARPVSYKDESGKPAGYSIALCERILEGVRADLNAPTVSAEWITVDGADRFRAVRDGQVDLLCGADTTTLARRGEVAFTLP